MDNIWKWISGINSAIIIEYLVFRFHLAENYVLKRDHQDVINAIFNKLDEISKCQQKILLELGKKAERKG